MRWYSTGEVAKKLNVSIRTLRYYDQIGLIVPSEKNEYGKRLYNEEDLLTLQKIMILKMLNLSLDDIKKILSKITIEQLLQAHKKALQLKMNQLQHAVHSTNTIINSMQMEGDLKWEQLIPLIEQSQEKQKNHVKWKEYFDEQEQATLKEKLPKMEKDNAQIKSWIHLIRRIELCLQRGDTPFSEEAQLIAEEALALSEALFNGNKELEAKFLEIRKSPEKSSNLNLYPVKEDVLNFADEAIQIYLDKETEGFS